MSTPLAAPASSALVDAVRTLRTGQAATLNGVHTLGDGTDAFAARIALIDAATRSLDLQYYIWHDDLTGGLLLDALRRAADRGVRVRLLLDDNNTSGMDGLLAALDEHPSVELRLFNPFMQRKLRVAGYLSDFSRLNRRMHNKALIADGVACVVGGRRPRTIADGCGPWVSRFGNGPRRRATPPRCAIRVCSRTMRRGAWRSSGRLRGWSPTSRARVSGMPVRRIFWWGGSVAASTVM